MTSHPGDEHAVPPLLLDDASTEEILTELWRRTWPGHPGWFTFVVGVLLGLLVARPVEAVAGAIVGAITAFCVAWFRRP